MSVHVLQGDGELERYCRRHKGGRALLEGLEWLANLGARRDRRKRSARIVQLKLAHRSVESTMLDGTQLHHTTGCGDLELVVSWGPMPSKSRRRKRARQ